MRKTSIVIGFIACMFTEVLHAAAEQGLKGAYRPATVVSVQRVDTTVNYDYDIGIRVDCILICRQVQVSDRLRAGRDRSQSRRKHTCGRAWALDARVSVGPSHGTATDEHKGFGSSPFGGGGDFCSAARAELAVLAIPHSAIYCE
jgi:hypothetical protein